MLQTQSHFLGFIDVKSSQVCFFLQAFWHQDLPHRELQLFFWDTLEEWNQIKTITNLPYTRREQVFWHLLQQIHFWKMSCVTINICVTSYAIAYITCCMKVYVPLTALVFGPRPFFCWRAHIQ